MLVLITVLVTQRSATCMHTAGAPLALAFQAACRALRGVSALLLWILSPRSLEEATFQGFCSQEGAPW